MQKIGLVLSWCEKRRKVDLKQWPDLLDEIDFSGKNKSKRKQSTFKMAYLYYTKNTGLESSKARG
jgi:hypothetical protein